jgi:LPS-assembly lipoprotein
MDTLSRRLFLAGLAPVAAALAGCGFQPLMARPEVDASISMELAAIRIGDIGEDEDRRVGQLLRNELIDRFTAGVGEQPQRYYLAIDIDQRTSALQIQNTDTVTRYNLELIARFRLYENGSNETIYAADASAISSYDVVDSEYATLVAEQGSARAASRDLSNTIAALLALYFRRQGA